MRVDVRHVEKPWGHEKIFAHTDRYVGKILHIEPHQALSLQLHRQKDETFFVLRGSIRLEVEVHGELRSLFLEVGQSYHVAPGTRHRMIAGADGCELCEVSTPELEDVVRLEDRYGRV
jgi:mannose-6-phosphate isomerase-like protein (cupin superfamily)